MGPRALTIALTDLGPLESKWRIWRRVWLPIAFPNSSARTSAFEAFLVMKKELNYYFHRAVGGMEKSPGRKSSRLPGRQFVLSLHKSFQNAVALFIQSGVSSFVPYAAILIFQPENIMMKPSA